MVRTCVTWDVLLVLLNPPQDLTSCRAGARPGHPISGLKHRTTPHPYSITASRYSCFGPNSALRPISALMQMRPGLGHRYLVMTRNSLSAAALPLALRARREVPRQ